MIGTSIAHCASASDPGGPWRPDGDCYLLYITIYGFNDLSSYGPGEGGNTSFRGMAIGQGGGGLCEISVRGMPIRRGGGGLCGISMRGMPIGRGGGGLCEISMRGMPIRRSNGVTSKITVHGVAKSLDEHTLENPRSRLRARDRRFRLIPVRPAADLAARRAVDLDPASLGRAGRLGRTRLRPCRRNRRPSRPLWSRLPSSHPSA